MTDWTKQTETMMQTWVDAQKKLRDSWLEAMKGMGGPQSKEVWTKTTNAWEESVMKVLDAQTEWTRLWVESFTSNVPSTSNEVTDWAKQGQDMMNHWNESQKRLWENWFEMAKKLEPAQGTATWDQETGQNMMKSWQEATQKMMDTQAEWMQRWSALNPTGNPTKK